MGRHGGAWEVEGVRFGDGLAVGCYREGVSKVRPRLLSVAKVELLCQRSERFYDSY